MKEEKRSPDHKIIRLATDTQGVGGRHNRAPSPIRRGGYQDICTNLEKKLPAPDPFIAELEELGIGEPWIEVARAVGEHLFLTLWRILDENNSGPDPQPGKKTRIRVPKYSNYLRYQRDRLVIELCSRGMSPSEIRDVLERETRENISTSHIYTIIKKHKIKS